MSEPASAGATLFAAVVLSVTHPLAVRVHSLGLVPGRDWLSAGGGATVAYVFVHLLPELGRGQEVMGTPSPLGGFLDRHVYVLALAGFVAFYGLEHMARRGAPRDGPEVNPQVFWVHVGSFAAYNALIGYLLVHRDQRGLVPLFLFTIAMALHFLVNDHGLREHFEERYETISRWLLSGAVLSGWAVGRFTAVPETVVHASFALLAGSIVLNVVKEELPEHCATRFGPFFVGAVGYTVLLLAVE